MYKITITPLNLQQECSPTVVHAATFFDHLIAIKKIVDAMFDVYHSVDMEDDTVDPTASVAVIKVDGRRIEVARIVVDEVPAEPDETAAPRLNPSPS